MVLVMFFVLGWKDWLWWICCHDAKRQCWDW